MKRKMERIKVGLVAVLLIIGVNASAQLIAENEPATLQPRLSGSGTEAIFVYGGSGFKLTASTTSTGEGGAAGETFTDFTWLIRNDAGGGDGIGAIESATAVVGGTVNQELTVTDLAPGFYTFIAQGTTEGEICSADPEEFTVFVLAPLTVSITPSGTDDIYCSDDVPDAKTLTATASYDASVDFNEQTNLTAPTLDAFELRYRWYKVEDGSALDLETATPFATNTPSTNTTEDIYTLNSTNDVGVGSWNYYVVVDYTVKAFGSAPAVLGGGTPTVIQVTPKPGKPTITIEAIID